MKHANIAFFVPHAGCPHTCSFCNQRSISGQTKQLLPDDVRQTLDGIEPNKALASDTQLAFFGGSFTAIDREYMTSLLEAAAEYAGKGIFNGIRVSTRPDAVSAEVLDILRFYGVTAVELGAQSTDDEVLALNERGHTGEDVARASRLIKEYGISLGLQMMTGLYADTDKKSVKTCEDLIALEPDTVRIYPTIVLEGTRLAELYGKGLYSPQTLEDSVRLCAVLLQKFRAAGIRVIRLGLHSGGNVAQGYVAGPYHPAFGELCESRIFYDIALKALSELQPPCSVELYVNPTQISKMTGQKRQNLEKLSDIGYNCSVKPDASLEYYSVTAKRV